MPYITEEDKSFIEYAIYRFSAIIYAGGDDPPNVSNDKVIDFIALSKKIGYEIKAAEDLGGVPLRSADNVVSQFNNIKKLPKEKSPLKNTEEEYEEKMIKLKYGQGSIIKRERYTKKGTLNKYYEGRYYDEFGKIKSVYGHTRLECYERLREAHPDKKERVSKQKYVSVKEWLSIWYNDFKKNTLRESSRRSYEMIMNTYIFPKIGDKKLVAVSGEDLQKFLNDIEGANTRQKVYLVLSAALRKATVLRKILFNPCEAVELPRYKKKKRRPFDYTEQEKILSCEKENVRQIFFFLCVTGLRVGEFLALKKDDFFFEDNFFKVDKSIVYGQEGDTKSEAGNRIIYFTDELLDNFDLNLLGKYTYAGLRTLFRRVFASLKIKDVSLHCTRHTFATICHSFGMNDKTLQTLLGHSTLAMTQDVYTHFIKKGSSKIRSYLEGLCAFIRTTI